MARTVLPDVVDERRREVRSPRTATRLVRGSLEAVVLVMVCLAPWAFGTVEPEHEFLLDVGVAILMVLWGAQMLLEGQLCWRKCPVAVCLAAWVVLGVWQITPLPRGLLNRISPATARMYDRLLPAQPEVLPFGEPTGTSSPPPGSTLSLYPGATRKELAGYLAILLLFAAVRQNIASSTSLRRLAIALFINGSLLALFGIAQALSAEPETIYWSYPVPGAAAVFGPFIDRNHFAFYLNVCLGLGAGLLLSWNSDPSRMHEAGHSIPGDAVAERARTGVGNRIPSLDPLALGMVFALALMISSVAYSLSRGGFLALLGGSILGLALWLPRLRWSGQGRIVLLTGVIVLGLVSWLGYDRVVMRLGTFKGDMMGRDSRWAIWSRAVPSVLEFPLWGTGYGTYEIADSLRRSGTTYAHVMVEHAHNDYLEALVEGGLALFIPVVVAVVLVFRFALRAVARHRDRPVGGLVLGALMGSAAVAIQSLTEFGMHIPANAAIVTVLCAQLCAVGRERVGAGSPLVSDREPEDSDRYVLRLGGLAPVLGAASVVALGLALAGEGWRAHRAQQLRLVAQDREASGDPDLRAQKGAALEAAIRLVPEYAGLHGELADTYLDTFQQRMEELAERGAGIAGADPAATADQAQPDGADRERLVRTHLVPALRHLLRARDACPLKATTQLKIAGHVDEFDTAEPRESYLERVKFLDPADHENWERCGALELRDGRPDQAWTSWRRSLELSDSLLPEILDRSAVFLSPQDILRRVLPDRPDLLLKAALYLYPPPGDRRRPLLEWAHALLDNRLPEVLDLSAGLLGPGDILCRILPDRAGLLLVAASHLYAQAGEGRRLFLERALALSEKQPAPLGAADLALKASIHRALGQPAEAVADYRALLHREPLDLARRYELAELLYEQDRFRESFQELLKIQALQPENDGARKLMDLVREKIAEGK